MAGWQVVYRDTQCATSVFNFLMTGTVKLMFPSEIDFCFSSLDQ